MYDATMCKRIVTGSLLCALLLFSNRYSVAADAKPTKDQIIKGAELAIMIHRLKEFNIKNEIQRRKGVMKPNLNALKKMYDDMFALSMKTGKSSYFTVPINTSSADSAFPLIYDLLANTYKAIETVDGQLMVYNQKTTTLKTKVKNVFKRQGKETSTTSKEDKASIKAKLIEEDKIVEDLSLDVSKSLAANDDKLTTVQGWRTKFDGNELVFHMLFESFLLTVSDFLTYAQKDLFTVQQRMNALLL